MISRTTARQKELQLVEEKANQAREKFLRQLKAQVVEQKLSGTELLRMKAAQVGASDAAEVYIRKLEAAKVATHSLGLESAGARRELGVLAGELLRGNFGAAWLQDNPGESGRVARKMMTLRGLGIAGVVGGIAASVVLLGKAWYEGGKEAEEFNKQLILTGNYAGKTSTTAGAGTQHLRKWSHSARRCSRISAGCGKRGIRRRRRRTDCQCGCEASTGYRPGGG